MNIRYTNSFIGDLPIYSTNQTLDEILFPHACPYHEGYLQVSKLHEIWYGEYGNPDGIPILLLHSGPGNGSSPNLARIANPKTYRIILFDQRGTGKSKPFATTNENTTQAIVEDIEQLRNHLKIKRWIISGAYWGSALALAYGEKYPNSCLGFVMSGILLGTEREYTHLWYGMKDYFPEIWEEFAQCLPSEERSNLILGYYSKLMSENTQVQMRFARAFVKYIFSCVFLRLDLKLIEKILQHDLFVHSFAKIFIYYSKNNFFLLENQLLEKVDKLIHLPVFIVQGRHDKLCPARSAYKLYKKWPGAELIFVEDANHPLLEAGMAKVVVEVIDKMKDLVKCSVG